MTLWSAGLSLCLHALSLDQDQLALQMGELLSHVFPFDFSAPSTPLAIDTHSGFALSGRCLLFGTSSRVFWQDLHEALTTVLDFFPP